MSRVHESAESGVKREKSRRESGKKKAGVSQEKGRRESGKRKGVSREKGRRGIPR